MTARSITMTLLILLAASAATGEEPRQDAASADVRTLDAITIEGAVDVPRVLFITSRDNVRYDDGLGWSFLPRAASILASVKMFAVIPPAAFQKDSEQADQSVPQEPASPEAKE